MTFRGDPTRDVFERLLQEHVEGVELLERTFAEVDEAMNTEELMYSGAARRSSTSGGRTARRWTAVRTTATRHALSSPPPRPPTHRKMNGGSPEVITLSQDHKVLSPCEQQRIREAGIKMEEGQARINGVGVAR